MAEYTLSEAAERLRTLGDRISKQCVDIMKSETPVGRTGNLKNSIKSDPLGNDQYFIGTDMYYAEWVEKGRGEVNPKPGRRSRRGGAPSLRWVDYNGDSKSIHHGNPGEVIFRPHAGPSKPNPFVDRAKARIDNTHFSL